MNDNTALFLFDFDGTLVKGHSPNYIGEELANLRYLLNGRIGFKSHKEYEQFTKKNSIDLMKGILESGHKIAIVSYNDYPDAVKYAIEQLLGKEIADKVYIKSALPSYNHNEIQRSNKVLYIQEVMRNTGITKKENVFFMDDDLKHVVAAKEFGIKAVLVEKEGREYINKAWKFFEEFNETHGIFNEFNEPFIEPEDVYNHNGVGFCPAGEEHKNWGSTNWNNNILGDHYKIN
ncbi:MAG: hypothetical protein RCO49_05070 [Rickettsia endosymbiont of Argas persicus]